MPIVAQDFFGNLTLGANWLSINVPTGQDNTQFPVAMSGGYSTQANKLGQGFAHWVGAGSFDPINQYSRAVILSEGPPTRDGKIGVAVQIPTDGQSGYFMLTGPTGNAINPPVTEFWKAVSSVLAQQSATLSEPAQAPGDVITALALGNMFGGFYNGVLIFLFFDTGFTTTGVPGIHAANPNVQADGGLAIVGGSWDAGSFDFNLVFNDVFGRADGALGPHWASVGLPDIVVKSNGFAASNPATANQFAQIVPTISSQIQWASCKVVSFDTISGSSISPCPYVSGQGSGGTFACYRAFETASGSMFIQLIQSGGAGATTVFSKSGLTTAVGDTILLLKIQKPGGGQVQSVFQNGVLIGQSNSNTIIDGTPGISIVFDSVGDDFASGTFDPPPLPINPNSPPEGFSMLPLFFVVDYQIHKEAPPLYGDADFYRKPIQRALITSLDASNSAILKILLNFVPLLDGESIDILRVYPTPENSSIPFFPGTS